MFFPVAGSGEDATLELVERLRCVDDEHRDVDHGRPPLLSVSLFEQNRQASYGLRRVVGIRLSARQRKPSYDRYATGEEYLRFGDRLSLAVALEVTGNTDPFGMIAPKSGMRSVHVFKRVDNRRRRQLVRCEPTARI